MADDPKPTSDPGKPAAAENGANSNVSPAPADDDKNPNPTSKVIAEPLSDGTVPTVLNPGESHRSVAKGKTSLTSVYRKADIMTTLLTFGGAVIAAAIILGVYVYLTRAKPKPVAPPKQTSLSSSDLSKLGSFFSGNAAGGSGEVLTVSSPSLFNARVAVNSDLKVTGGVEVGGTSTLSNLTVNAITNLGVANVTGALTVSGPVNLQSPATLSGGGTVKGNLAVSGNGSFGGSISAGVISVSTLTVTSTLNLNGHLSIGGQTPGTSPVPGVTSNASVDGNDSAGTVSVTILPTSGESGGAALAQVQFHTPYVSLPVIVISPVGRASATVQPFVTPAAGSFTIGSAVLPAFNNATSVTFNYWIVQF